MIVRLRGTVIDVHEDSVVLDRDGVAREVLIPHFAIGELTPVMGREITLYTMEFFEGGGTNGPIVPRMIGFTRPDDRAFFRIFITVKGIGPKRALKALAEPVASIAEWIESADTRALCRLPGIGKRAAELIVAQLRGKVRDIAIGSAGSASAAPRFTPDQRDALEILLAWGEPRADVEKWLEQAAELEPETDSPQAWVKAAYKVKSGVAG